ncbi:MAG TPA: response regulator transcription factor [Brevefilum sp.]|nr:response regulator transcription factor [Brevefilum sp.]HOR19838.1 response regulator transcription factor [Brevefilum sp.]HPL68892.1 response regulator transcription factor [Brevefilum sp.]
MIKVLICDDQEIVCEGLKHILEADSEIKVVGVAHNGLEALDVAAETQPDLVLMDLKMPVMNGVQATRKLRELYPKVHILILTTYTDDEWLFNAIRSGASGYLLKDRPRKELIDAIKGTAAGEAYIDPSVARKVLENVNQPPEMRKAKIKISLSPRESEILHLLSMGLSNSDIAQRLFLSEGTVRNYMSDLFSKLDVSDRTQAVIVALRSGLVDINKL